MKWLKKDKDQYCPKRLNHLVTSMQNVKLLTGATSASVMTAMFW